MPVWLTSIVPAAIGLIKSLFTTHSDNERKVEEAKAKAEEAKANAEASQDNKNAALSKNNKHVYIIIVIGAIVSGLLFAGILPDLVISLFENIQKVFSTETLERILTLLEELIRALAGITQE